MSKIITSPVKRFPGTVTLQDPLYYPQVIAFQRAVDAAQALPAGSYQIEYDRAVLPGLLAAVEEWNITGVDKHPTPDTFPVSPIKAAHALHAWLMQEVGILFAGDEIPND